jgi:hypothetical protein
MTSAAASAISPTDPKVPSSTSMSVVASGDELGGEVGGEVGGEATVGAGVVAGVVGVVAGGVVDGVVDGVEGGADPDGCVGPVGSTDGWLDAVGGAPASLSEPDDPQPVCTMDRTVTAAASRCEGRMRLRR